MRIAENIVILDDDYQFLNLIRSVSEKSGFRVQTYDNPREFLSHEFGLDDLIILDLSMPEIDGIEVLRELSKHHNVSKIVLSSGQDKGVVKAAEDLAKAMHLNHVGTFSKPIKISEYKAFLNESEHLNTVGEIPDSSIEKATIVSEEDICKAIYTEQFIPFYQPQYSLATGKLYGFEVLARWMHPDHGLVPPNDFIPIAEQHNLINGITDIILSKSLTDLTFLKNHFNSTITLSINISALSLNDPCFPEKMEGFCLNHQIEPKDVILEITESALMREVTTSLEILARLRMKGFGLSIDDFGTGYSSLSLLHKIPFTELKIDRSFVQDMFRDSDCHAIVETCIVLAKKLNMTVVAEGVETQDVFNALSDLECEHCQGYYLGKPASLEQTLCEVGENRE
ncbi:diguanylate cyclase/phosphodiesterase (GGDEF & EAL domains) with PAS/PAC sensor(s) [Pseudoalteromonas luteoviolacea B = ATCC 29581]|nr:diguanylate cyclase/phosphodiesterase (GGDEF & EAL domains) with PAS/PAC sensor(s) [Pseudoalteromonas luteoviolacea B = ATCC 29581]